MNSTSRKQMKSTSRKQMKISAARNWLAEDIISTSFKARKCGRNDENKKAGEMKLKNVEFTNQAFS